MFTSGAQALIDRGKEIAVSRGERMLSPLSVAAAIAADTRAAKLLANVLEVDVDDLRSRFAAPDQIRQFEGTLPLTSEMRAMLALALELVRLVPTRRHPTLIALPHLVCATALSIREALPGEGGPNHQDLDPQLLYERLAAWTRDEESPRSLGELTSSLRRLRVELLGQIYGQDQAIHQFVEGLFNVEVVREADTARRKPAGLFVFAGPPGVGKTFLAELAAGHLERPFLRFDMSGFAQAHEVSGLIGSPPMYRGAEPGALTEFVRKNPEAVLLFDEIEKAHETVIHLFLQMLDAGRLQDKFTEDEIAFRDTIVILTTNVGRSLYDNENSAGVNQANAAFHRATVLDALRSERDERTGEPHFPAAICSRMATGYPILFNHLQVSGLALVAGRELARVAALLTRQHGQQFYLADEIPLALVMREGARSDARTVKARSEAFLKEEVFKACGLFADERIDTKLAAISRITIEIDTRHAGDEAGRLFADNRPPAVLFVGDTASRHAVSQTTADIEWHHATSAEQAFDMLANDDLDFMLLDLAYVEARHSLDDSREQQPYDTSTLADPDKTLWSFDHSPPSARRFADGQRLLEQLHTRMSDFPVYLLALEDTAEGSKAASLDEELLLACIRAGGARGAVRVPVEPGGTDGQKISFRDQLHVITRNLRLEKVAADLARQNQVVTFDTAPVLNDAGDRLRLRCRNFRLVRAPRSEDTQALVSDAERPELGFDDVIGASGAKEALTLISDWLRNPKKYSAAGVDPPKGVLLTGPPGTGKTMLARALAGESECAFITEAATGFVTKWQGSGPENIRALFARARRYAPSIVFIDEIDAIGKKRGAGGGDRHGEEVALNALLTEMDGFAQDPSRPVIVIAATNLVETLDPALLRRFARAIEVELPTRPERALYLRTRLAAKSQHRVSEQMIERLAGQGLGMSIADLERTLAQAAVLALDNGGVIDDAVLSEAFERIQFGEARAGRDPLRTARHEAGHALVSCLTGEPPIYVTIVGRGDFGGYAAYDDRGERGSQTRSELERRIAHILGGREAERLYYADGEADSTGPSSDLAQATAIAEAMVYEFGMAEEVGFVRIDRSRLSNGTLADSCHAAVRRIIDQQSERTQQLLQEHKATLDRIGEALMQKNRLLRHELVELLTEEERHLAEGRS